MGDSTQEQWEHGRCSWGKDIMSVPGLSDWFSRTLLKLWMLMRRHLFSPPSPQSLCGLSSVTRQSILLSSHPHLQEFILPHWELSCWVTSCLTCWCGVMAGGRIMCSGKKWSGHPSTLLSHPDLVLWSSYLKTGLPSSQLLRNLLQPPNKKRQACCQIPKWQIVLWPGPYPTSCMYPSRRDKQHGTRFSWMFMQWHLWSVGSLL